MVQATRIAVAAGERLPELIFGPGESTFRHLLEKLPAGAYMCDANGLITYYNQKAVEVWGREPRLYDERDRYCGSFKLFRPDGAPVVHEACWMALAILNEREYNGEEIVVERPDGSRITVLAHANPIHDDDGRLLGAVNVLVDISERKWAEQILQQSHEELERRVEERTAALAASTAVLEREVEERKQAEARARQQATVASLLAIANANLYRQVRTQKVRLEQLSQRIIQADEEERKEISDELHESVGQMVTALLVELTLLRDKAASAIDDKIQETVTSLKDLTAHIHDDVRVVSHLLRPPALEIIGLDAALHTLCEQSNKLSGKQIVYQGATLPALSEAIAIGFYRFVQEALDNAVRHSQAATIDVSVQYEDDLLSVTVEDDGLGFDVSSLDQLPDDQNGVGLLRMGERLQIVGADLQISAAPGEGARLTASCHVAGS